MPTDDERRAVARRLREYVDLPDDWWADTYSGFYVEKCAFGDVERHRESELFARLADLIDPDCGTQEADSSPVPEHNADLSKMVDRDALLALAEEIEYGAGSDDGEHHDLPAIMVAAVARKQMEYARRIREALGVER